MPNITTMNQTDPYSDTILLFLIGIATAIATLLLTTVALGAEGVIIGLTVLTAAFTITEIYGYKQQQKGKIEL